MTRAHYLYIAFPGGLHDEQQQFVSIIASDTCEKPGVRTFL
jgi:hypothetical protein